MSVQGACCLCGHIITATTTLSAGCQLFEHMKHAHPEYVERILAGQWPTVPA